MRPKRSTPGIQLTRHTVFLQDSSWIQKELDLTVTCTKRVCRGRQRQAMFELAQGSRGSLPKARLDLHNRVIELRCAQPAESPKFIKLSSETFPDLKGRQLEFLNHLCLAAHHSEEFFLSVATNQWVRTSITCDKPPNELFSEELIVEERSKLISTITIHSNVLPCDLFWPKFQAVRDEASKRVHFPCSILDPQALQGDTLMKKLLEWRERREECEISQHKSESGFSRLFWAIGADEKDDVKPLKQFAEGSDGTIWQVTWRGGVFVRKDSLRSYLHNQDDSGPSSNPRSDIRDALDMELGIMERLSHPHLVYGFGVSYPENRRSLFMEYMQGDLSQVILDRVRTSDKEPPFSHPESIDILLQFAKGMDHMHGENVVHGDLKSRNILISMVLVSENIQHFLVKVADFGSAREVSSNAASIGFKPAFGSTLYAAPEVLKFRENKDELTIFPYQIDVYSFGIVAFEVLTGEELYKDISYSSTNLKKGVIEGTLRPPLHVVCQEDNFLNNKKLVSLIESCWHGDPSKRPSFAKIVEVLESVRVQILEAPTSLGNDALHQANSIPSNASEAQPEGQMSGSNGHQRPPPVQATNTSDVQGCKSSSRRRTISLWKYLRPFSCVSGGDVKS